MVMKLILKKMSWWRYKEVEKAKIRQAVARDARYWKRFEK